MEDPIRIERKLEKRRKTSNIYLLLLSLSLPLPPSLSPSEFNSREDPPATVSWSELLAQSERARERTSNFRPLLGGGKGRVMPSIVFDVRKKKVDSLPEKSSSRFVISSIPHPPSPRSQKAKTIDTRLRFSGTG